MCVYVCMRAYVCVYLCVRAYVCVCVCVCVRVCPGRWVAFEKAAFSGEAYVLEKGLYGSHEDWGAQAFRIGSIQPAFQVGRPHGNDVPPCLRLKRNIFSVVLCGMLLSLHSTHQCCINK